MAEDSEVLATEQHGGVLVLTLNRPASLNALDTDLRVGLSEMWQRLRTDETVKIVVLTGAGDRAFCVGRDLKESAAAYDEGRAIEYEQTGSFGYVPKDFEKPVIAAVNGYCLGSGFRIAVSCHLRFAAESATFGNPQIKRGRGTAMPLLLRQAGVPLAAIMDLVLTGESVEAQTALRWGLVSRVLPDDRLLDETIRVATQISKYSPTVRSGVMRAHAYGLLDSPTTSEKVFDEIAQMMGTTDDAVIGARAFADKVEARYGDT